MLDKIIAIFLGLTAVSLGSIFVSMAAMAVFHFVFGANVDQFAVVPISFLVSLAFFGGLTVIFMAIEGMHNY